MTKEELREHCEKQVKACEMWAKHRGQEPSGKVYEEHKLILDLIKLSEQQPCDDCVSRQAVIDLINADWKYEGLELSVNELPPVTPIRKVGKWVKYNTTDKKGRTKTACDLLIDESVKLEKIEQIVNEWNNDASNSFGDMCKINGIVKE